MAAVTAAATLALAPGAARAVGPRPPVVETVTATATEEAAAWGAALCAGAGAGLFASPTDDPRDLESIETTYQPNPERREMLERKYQVFLDLAEAMRPIWPRLQELGATEQ